MRILTAFEQVALWREATDQAWKEQWNPGDKAHFEYHCTQSPDSSDYHLWQRSYQPVTVIGFEPSSEHPEGLSFMERGEEGVPMSYRVRFPDGYEDTAMEDELVTHPRFFETQWAPPEGANPHAVRK